MFPYDTQETMLQIQSRDYSTSFIKIRTDSMNREFNISANSSKLDWTWNLKTMQNDLYLPSSSWNWQKVRYEIDEKQSQLRGNEPGFSYNRSQFTGPTGFDRS